MTQGKEPTQAEREAAAAVLDEAAAMLQDIAVKIRFGYSVSRIHMMFKEMLEWADNEPSTEVFLPEIDP